MTYQTKWHKLICDSFRYLSFIFVVLTLLSYIAFIWLGAPDRIFLTKIFVTTTSILLASVVVGFIFNESPLKLGKSKNVD